MSIPIFIPTPVSTPAFVPTLKRDTKLPQGSAALCRTKSWQVLFAALNGRPLLNGAARTRAHDCIHIHTHVYIQNLNGKNHLALGHGLRLALRGVYTCKGGVDGGLEDNLTTPAAIPTPLIHNQSNTITAKTHIALRYHTHIQTHTHIHIHMHIKTIKNPPRAKSWSEASIERGLSMHDRVRIHTPITTPISTSISISTYISKTITAKTYLALRHGLRLALRGV